MGDDPAAWPKPRIRPIPSTEDLIAEVQLWTEESELLQASLAEERAALLAAGKREVEATAAWVRVQEELEKAQRAIIGKDRACATAQKDTASAEKRARSAEAAVANGTGRVQQAEAAAANLKKLLNEMQVDVQARTHTLATTEELLSSTGKALRKAEAKLVGARERADVQRATIEKQQKTIRERERACAESKARADSLEHAPDRVMVVENENSHLRNELERSKNACASAVKSRQRADAAAAKSKEAVSILTTRCQELKAGRDKAVAAHTKLRANAHDRLKASGDVIEAAHQRVVEAEARATAAEARATTAEEQAAMEVTLAAETAAPAELGLDDKVAAAKRAWDLAAVLGADTPWSKIEAVLRITL
jgi:chromosome segregation ATPase